MRKRCFVSFVLLHRQFYGRLFSRTPCHRISDIAIFNKLKPFIHFKAGNNRRWKFGNNGKQYTQSQSSIFSVDCFFFALFILNEVLKARFDIIRGIFFLKIPIKYWFAFYSDKELDWMRAISRERLCFPRPCNAPDNVKPQGGGGWVGHEVGILKFSEKMSQIPHLRDNITGQKYQKLPPWGE